jgi:hypothetical protein
MADKIKMSVDGFGNAFQALNPSTTVVVAIGGTSAQNSSPIVAEVVRLIATSDCHVKFSPTGGSATTSDMFLKAGVAEYFSMKGDQYIAVIQATAGGNLFITNMV